MKKTVAVLFAALAFSALPAHAGQWDDLRNQWREEYKQVKDADIPALERQAANGDVRAIYMLSTLLLVDKRYAQNDTSQQIRMQQWICQIGETGHAIMMTTCAYTFQLGVGAAKSNANAVAWYRKAANTGYALAMNRLGWMYLNGELGLSKDYAEAVAWCRKAAEQGNADGQANLGFMYREGKGVQQSDTEAVAWYRKAAEQSNALGQQNLGVMYRDGKGVAQSDTEAVKWFRKAAEQGNAYGQASLGAMYFNGKGVAQSDTEAVAWFRKAAEQGNAQGQFNLGGMYFNGKGVAQSNTEAVAWFRKSAEQGNADGQFNLGGMYLVGKGVAQSDAEAVAWFRKAAEQGNANGQNNLGFMYREGKGVAQSDTEAVAWYRKAAEQGETNGQFSLGWMYDKGKGVAQDDTQAVTWYRKAADKGVGGAMHNLGTMYRDGRVVSKLARAAAALLGLDAGDYAQAAAWYRKAAEAGVPLAMYDLGKFYENGKGVAKDANEAARWYLKAFAVGQKEAEEHTDTDNGARSKNLSKENLETMIADGRLTDPALIRQVRALSRLAPKLDWVALPQNPDSEEITLTVRTTDVGGGVGDVKLLVDGRMVEAALSGEARGLQRRQDSGATRSFKLKLPTGAHKVEVWAYSLDNVINYTVLPATITSRYQKVRKPRLFALVLGINEYENAQLKLQYARPDAVAVAQALNAQAGTLYESVTVKLLQDKNSTRKASILAALQAWAGEGDNKPEFNDVFIFYVAGHAMSYQDGGYYLLTSDVLQSSEDRVKPASISHLELRDALAAIRSGKKLALLDTCHAGKSLDAGTLLASRGMDEQDIIERMNRRSGATVLMASETSEQALEGYQGHGVFTYALLQGLAGAAANKDDMITTDLLKVWIEDQVPEISDKIFHHKQTPFASLAGQGFPIAVGKKR